MSVNMGDIPVDELKHYGVKGMKWGVTRTSTGNSKPSSSEIKGARKRAQDRLSKLEDASFDYHEATTKQGRNAARKVMNKTAKEILETDDARIANKMTRGEKIANVVVGGPFGVAVVAQNNRLTSESNWDKHSQKRVEKEVRSFYR